MFDADELRDKLSECVETPEGRKFLFQNSMSHEVTFEMLKSSSQALWIYHGYIFVLWGS